MKKVFLLIVFSLLFCSDVWGAELDVDRNGAVDVNKGGTNQTTLEAVLIWLGLDTLEDAVDLNTAKETNLNPVADGVTITGAGITGDPLVAVGGVDLASPGEIGAVAPDIVNATQFIAPFVDGEAAFTWTDTNTTYTPAAGEYGIVPIAGVMNQILNGVASPIGSSGADVTTQIADPTSTDSTGFYLSTGTTKFWYRDSTLGNYDFGTYTFTADPSGTDYTSTSVAAYFMNDSTSELDESGNGNTLTVSAGDTIPTSADVATGYSGTSRDFESSDNDFLYQADGGGLDISGASNLLIAVWIKFESGTGADQTFARKYEATGNQRQYSFKYDDADDRIEGSISSNGTAVVSAFSTAGWSTFGTGWHHFAMYLDSGTDLRIYVDGYLNGSPVITSSSIFNSTSQVYIGSSSGGAALDGLKDELIIDSGTYTATDILNMYTDGISGNKGGSD